MATANDILRIANSQLGYSESPAGSNRTKFGAWYGMNGQPWCDMFVSWCGSQAGAEDIIGKFAYCPYHVNWFRRQNRWAGRERTPERGWIIFFANNGLACHIGIVESVQGNTIVTIEGNTSAGNNANGGQVQRRNRTLGTAGSNWYILGYGIPAYEEDDGMKLSDTFTRPDGRVVSLETFLGYKDQELESMKKDIDQLKAMIGEIHSQITTTSDNGAGHGTDSGATMAQRIPYVEAQTKLIAEKVGAEVL